MRPMAESSTLRAARSVSPCINILRYINYFAHWQIHASRIAVQAMRDDLTTEALKALRRILRAADLGTRRLAAATGLSPSQLLVLQEIDQRGETTPSALSGALQFGQATITSILDRLEAAALITRRRSSRDKRQILLATTDAGRAVIDRAPDLLQTRFSEGFDALPPWERAMILAALERLGVVLGAETIDAAPLLDAGAIDRPSAQ